MVKLILERIHFQSQQNRTKIADGAPQRGTAGYLRGSQKSRIQNQQQKRGVKKICCPALFKSHKYHKIETCYTLELVTKKI